MTVKEIMIKLEALGSESYRKTMAKHGSPKNYFGVKIGDMKPMVKAIKKDYQLALDLYATGNGDAQYFAGLIADDMTMTKKDLQLWADTAGWQMISEYTVPWVAAGSPHGWDLGLKWIENKKEPIATAGWNTLSSWVAMREDGDLDIPKLKSLIDRVVTTIHDQPERVKYTMNGFVIAVGGYVIPLYEHAMKAANQIGTVSVDMHGTACQVPDAAGYLKKMKARGLGKKRKSVKC